MGDQNIILKQPLTIPVRDTIRGAVTRVSLTLTPHDLPYYFVRVAADRPLQDQVFEPDPYVPHTERSWKLIPTRVYKDTNPLWRELEFLEGLGLAMEIPNSRGANGSVQYAISPIASIFYGGAPNEGIFINVGNNREEKARRYINLLLTYVLPGMYWRNYYATHGLSPHIHLTEHLGREMLEISALWDDLRARFPPT